MASVIKRIEVIAIPAHAMTFLPGDMVEGVSVGGV